MILGILFSLVGLGVLVALMFNLAIFALPLFAAVTAGRLAFGWGAGVLGAIAVGFIVGAATLALGQLILALHRSATLRLIVSLLFVGPAAYAGYHLVLGLSRIGGAHGVWQPVFAGIGAAAVATAALARLLTPLVPAPTIIGTLPGASARGMR
jgi:hypothetical protein